MIKTSNCLKTSTNRTGETIIQKKFKNLIMKIIRKYT